MFGKGWQNLAILAIEAASMVSGVAVAEEGRLLAEMATETGHVHAETLMPHVETALQLAGVSRRELDAVATSIGPGSFTGLRIALATAKMMAYALKIPLVTVGTLEALAYHLPVPQSYVGTLMDAQKGNAYAALYSFDADALSKVVRPVQVMPLMEAVYSFAEVKGVVTLMGDLVAKRLSKLKDLPPNVQIAPPHVRMPRAATVAFLAWQKLKRGETTNPMLAEPFYVRRSEAEVLWEKRHAEDKA